MIYIAGIIVIFILLIIKQFKIKITYHQKHLYLCYSVKEKDSIYFGEREIIKIITLW